MLCKIKQTVLYTPETENERRWLKTHPGNLWWTCVPKVVEE